jgi:hypothetical protein
MDDSRRAPLAEPCSRLEEAVCCSVMTLVLMLMLLAWFAGCCPRPTEEEEAPDTDSLVLLGCGNRRGMLLMLPQRLQLAAKLAAPVMRLQLPALPALAAKALAAVAKVRAGAVPGLRGTVRVL